MSEDIERAQHGIESAHHAHQDGDRTARLVAVLIAILAAALALAEMAEKDAQTSYLAHQVTVSDDWNFYQAKHLRATLLGSEIDTLRSLPGAADNPEIQARIAAAQRTAARLENDPKGGEGSRQLMEKARRQEELRDEAAHRTHQMERVVGLLQIAIVLASVSVIARTRSLAAGAAALGAVSALYGLLAGWHLI